MTLYFYSHHQSLFHHLMWAIVQRKFYRTHAISNIMNYVQEIVCHVFDIRQADLLDRKHYTEEFDSTFYSNYSYKSTVLHLCICYDD